MRVLDLIFSEEHADFWRVWHPLHWIPSLTDQLIRLLLSDCCLTCELLKVHSFKKKVFFKWVLPSLKFWKKQSHCGKREEGLWGATHAIEKPPTGSQAAFPPEAAHWAHLTDWDPTPEGSKDMPEELRGPCAFQRRKCSYKKRTQLLQTKLKSIQLSASERERCVDPWDEDDEIRGKVPLQGTSWYSTMRLIQLFTHNAAVRVKRIRHWNMETPEFNLDISHNAALQGTLQSPGGQIWRCVECSRSNPAVSGVQPREKHLCETEAGRAKREERKGWQRLKRDPDVDGRRPPPTLRSICVQPLVHTH